MVFGFLQNIGPWQLLIVVAVIALLFGGSKIPELARSLGKAKGEFKNGLAEGEKEEAEKKPAMELTLLVRRLILTDIFMPILGPKEIVC